jgi:hypothetical protein
VMGLLMSSNQKIRFRVRDRLFNPERLEPSLCRIVELS